MEVTNRFKALDLIEYLGPDQSDGKAVHWAVGWRVQLDSGEP